MGIYSLKRRRLGLRGDLIETFKILTGKEHVNCSKFFELADVTSGLRGHSLKLLNSQMELLQLVDCQRVEQATAGRRGCADNQHVQKQAGSTLARYGHFKLTGYIGLAHQPQVSSIK